MLAEACRSGLRREPRDRLNRWFRLAHCPRLDQVDWSDHAPIPHTTQRTDAALESLDLEVRGRLEAETVTWASSGPRRFSNPSGIAVSNRCPLSAALSGVGACWTATIASIAAAASELVPGGGCTAVWSHPGPAGRVSRRSSSSSACVGRALVAVQLAGLCPVRQYHRLSAHPGPTLTRSGASAGCPWAWVFPGVRPDRESGFQVAIEHSNGSWQVRVWGRFEHADLKGVIERSRRHVVALRWHRADRIEVAPPRLPGPRCWRGPSRCTDTGSIGWFVRKWIWMAPRQRGSHV